MPRESIERARALLAHADHLAEHLAQVLDGPVLGAEEAWALLHQVAARVDKLRAAEAQFTEVTDQTVRVLHDDATSARDLVGHLEAALETRSVIEQAKGILMARERCDADQAFDILRRASQRENRKLRTIAQELVALVTAPASVPEDRPLSGSAPAPSPAGPGPR